MADQPAHPDSTGGRAANADDLREIDKAAHHKQTGKVGAFHGPAEGPVPSNPGYKEPALPWMRPFTTPTRLQGWLGESAQSPPPADNVLQAGLIANQECVSLATAAVGIRLGNGAAGSNVHEWRRGESAESGALKPGTPIATFLDRRGNTSDRYAGGGSGTPGAHLDHAAVFEGYVRDGNGKIVGMNVSEQYHGSGGIHRRTYSFGQGWGEGNASNYHAIRTAQGYLGGNRNPMGGGSAIAIAAGPSSHSAQRSSHIASTSHAVRSHEAARRDGYPNRVAERTPAPQMNGRMMATPAGGDSVPVVVMTTVTVTS